MMWVSRIMSTDHVYIGCMGPGGGLGTSRGNIEYNIPELDLLPLGFSGAGSNSGHASGPSLSVNGAQSILFRAPRMFFAWRKYMVRSCVVTALNLP